ANEPQQKMLHVGAANHVATLYQQTGELEKATELYTSNLALLAGAEQKQALGATHCALGSVLLERGDYDEAAGHLKEALRIGKETGDRRTLCRARDRLGDYHLRFGRFREALQVAQLGLEDAKTIDNLGAVSNSLRTLGRIYLTADEARHAEQTFKRALSVHEESGDAVSRGLSRLQLARFYLDVGDNLRARKHLDASRPDVESLGLPLLEGLFGLWSFVCLWREKGEYDKVGVDRALATFTRHGYHGELLDLLLAHSEVEIGALRYDEARTILENIRELTQEHRRPDLANEVSFILGRIYLRTGRENDAQTLLDAVRRRARDQHKLRLARLCEESLRGVTAQA
ncbi:MAG: tetratricopeptide repeat protein, partial [Planctomycetota bacterium]|nr:tetratricopeptide repeat protein [Planctomycetota bacterium]